jgi:NAD(P)-dependent dehydrogenase (short-subunit alcohol dehydrogenase family)
VARHLIAAGRPGAIVNLSSISGSTSLGRGIFAYGAAKAGIDGLTRDLAIEWASYGIRVNSVAPCQVRTEGFASVADKQSTEGDGLVERVLRGIPLGRLAESEDIGHAIQFLASDASAMITGVVLPVDGGNLAMNPGATLRPRGAGPS